MYHKIYIALAFTLVSIFSYSQGYSNYYIDSNIRANINHNVNGVIYENKTITNIDYGALALANAQTEKNKIEQQKITDEKKKNIALEIAEDPLKSYDYGYPFVYNIEKKVAKEYGFKSFTIGYVIPNEVLFNLAGEGRYQNISKDGITTEIIFYGPLYNKEKAFIDLEKLWGNENIVIGEETEIVDENNQKKKIFWHKKDFNRATVFGVKGYKSTVIWEDKFEYGITDNFISYNQNIGNGYTNYVKVRFYGDKDEVSFEQLEGRRFYFSLLIKTIISTAYITKEKI